MSRSETPTFDFRQAAARQFNDRPTLRQVASEQLLSVLLAELPWLAFVTPALATADPLMLDSPDPSTAHWTTQRLLDRVLQGLLDPQPLSVEPLPDGRHYNLALAASHRFAGSNSPFDSRQLSGLSNALNALTAQLPQRFREAQLRYWSSQGSAGVSRDRWLQLLLKTALLRGLSFQDLDEHERACIRGVIRGGSDQPSAFFVQVTVDSAARQYEELLCNLLVLGEWDERQVILWCAPSGVVRSFASLTAFERALRDDLAQRYAFERMSWQRLPVEGNVFAQQVAVMLDTMFNAVDRLRYGGLKDIAALEQCFARLSDPASWFVRYENDTGAVTPPPGLLASSAQASFACVAALVQIATYHLDSNGIAALQGVQSLHEFACQRLAERIREEHAEECSPDDILVDLYLARGMPGGAATGTGGGEPLVFAGSRTLSELAIGNLAALGGASIRQVRRRDGGNVGQWMNAESIRRLVADVDIGGRYPAYVANRLDDPGERAQRVRRFGREWRSTLLSSAVTGRLERKVSEAGLQCVVDFCAGHVDPAEPRMMLFPLAFRRSATSRQPDRVRGMYILYCAEPSLVLLYRPLYGQDTLREYASLEALLEHARESKRLQDSIVEWMAPAARAIYQQGGLQEPHIATIGTDFFAAPATPEPARLSIGFWRNDLDQRLYAANRELLVELADEQSVSNSENRWQTLTQGAWLLFDVATLLVRGPAAGVAWLVQLLASLNNDLQVLEQGEAFASSAAVADLLLNLCMTLLHARQPAPAVLPHEEPVDSSGFEGPAAQRGAFAEIAVAPVQAPAGSGDALAARAGRWLDFAWRGQNGFNGLPPARRQALLGMRSNVSLNGLEPLTTLDAQGLYRIGDIHYASLAGDAYRVERLPEGVRVVDSQGAPGPWLVRSDGVWRVDSALRLAGGMQRSSTRVRLANRFRELHEKISQLDLQVNDAMDRFGTQASQSLEAKGKLQGLELLRAKAAAEQSLGAQEGESASIQALLQRYDERIAQLEQDALTQRDQSIQQLETAASVEKTILGLLATIKEPKYASERVKDGWDAIIAQHEQSVRAGLIRNSDFIVDELWNLADYQQLAELQKGLDGQLIAQVPEPYRQLRRRLETVVGLQERMLLAQQQLDEVLTDTPDDFEVAVAPQPTRTVAQVIALRRFNTVQLRFQQVLHLADLALHLDSGSGASTLAAYREELTGLGLRSAADAHGDLVASNLPAADRIVILQEAWDEYTAALLNSDRIGKEGGQLIDPVMIERYREHVGRLKLDAGSRLVDAIRELDGASASDKRSPYPVSSEPQRLVRNGQGQLLIGNEVEVKSQRLVQVRESLSGQVLATFEQVDGEWREREGELRPLADEPPPEDLSMWVQSLLDASDSVREKAKAYVENDIKGTLLGQLFDQQLGKLGQAASVVRDAGGNDALLKALERDEDALRAERKLRLTTLYTDTSYPGAEALRFLHDEGLITVEYGERRTMQDGSAFDEYKVLRLPSRRNLWAAHFHLRAPDAYAQDFTVGHLKTWSQRRLSSRLAAGAGQRLHRGKLTLEQARGIIPFT
ncbi:hypothetical protein [Pseudomonas sp. NPDC089401]|uniref:hypothetical protein n=1 Tax=Pseudomonas sp. NPDC089401 TaxID=3364462 RepID=UPI00382DE389